MTSQTTFAIKLLTPSALFLALICAQPALAQPVSPSQLSSARQSYARSQEQVRSLRSKHSRSIQLYRETGSQRALGLAGRQQGRLQQAKVEKMQAKARYERLRAVQAKVEGQPGQARKHNSSSQRLFKQAKAMERALLQTARRPAPRKAPKSQAKESAKSTGQAAPVQGSSEAPVAPAVEAAAGQSPGGASPAPQQQQQQQAAVKGIASRQGKKQIQTALRNGEVGSALDILKRMEAEPSRSGLRGKLDNFRKRQMRNKVVNKVQKEALAAVKAGDAPWATEMSQLLLDEHKATRFRDAGKLAARMALKVENAAVASAGGLMSTGNYGEARQLMALARQIQTVQDRQPSKKMLRVERVAHQNVIGQMEQAAKSGDIGSFLAARKLAFQFHREGKADGRPNKALLLANGRLYLQARKNSIPRALKDALRLASGALGGVAPQEAEIYLRYAKDTRNMMTKRGVTLPRVVRRLFAKVEKKINQAKLAQSTMHTAKKPGIGRRLWNATFSVKGKHQYMPQGPTSIEDFRKKYQIEDMAQQYGVSVPQMREMIQAEQQRQMEQEQEREHQQQAQRMDDVGFAIDQRTEGRQDANWQHEGGFGGQFPAGATNTYNTPGFNFGNGGGAGGGAGGGFGGR